MKRNIITFLISILFATATYSQTIKTTKPFSTNPKADLLFLLPDGNYVGDILDSVKTNPREMELMQKFQAGLKKVVENDFAWYTEFTKSIPSGKPMPYNAKFGLTEKEYSELQGYMEKGTELLSTGKKHIQISRDKGVIKFKSENEGKVGALNYITIDLTKNTVIMADKILNFERMDKITSNKNALMSAWQGYSWKFQDPKDIDENSLKSLKDVSATICEVTVGRVEKSNETFIRLSVQVIRKGNSQQSDFSILF